MLLYGFLFNRMYYLFYGVLKRFYENANIIYRLSKHLIEVKMLVDYLNFNINNLIDV